ncbi:ATP-binding response regulator [Chromobacterium piscinae]|uniref:histidine kinase n=1 Tax=Chromobacterium piscinae TaxID=686831 RepID=A0ABV0HDP3_9NEIS|nr:hybrid sensor histidine kinase/response regulator [Chromobacterium vaccinii]MBX9358591.1 hybrid sensor histidine kinase/response regulator [Chromobacterium vaccinii]MCD5328576.1 hybrid sensor histidine kinase/response regulator [Chromobacterium piscinae]NHQ80366.1 response regulator [Chromobacterium vaccinii]
MRLGGIKRYVQAPWWLIVSLLVLLLAAAWNFYRIDRASQALIDGGKSEQLYWTVAQLHIELEKTRAELIGYAEAPTSFDPGAQFQLLQSRYQVFEAPDSVLVHRQLRRVAGFDALVGALGPLIHDKSWLRITPDWARRMVVRIDALRPVLANFAVQSREAEVSARVARTKALASQRSQMLMLQLVLCGGICGVLLVLMRFREVKELAEVRQSLLEQERAAHQATVALELDRTTFLGTLGHEIRSPLQSMQMCMELVEPAVTPQPAAQLALKRMKAGMAQLTSQIHDIMDISAIKNMQLRLNPGRVKPSAALRAVMDVMQPLADAKGLALRYEEASLPEWVLLDEIRLRQIVGNLVSNAIRYTDQGGVTLKARGIRGADQSELWLEVSDTGIGIAAEDRQRIFQPFSQGRNRRPGSSGLGLSIVKELVRLFGGSIEMESAVGTGSVFMVRLPLREVGGSEQSRSVLIVDDDDEIRGSVAELLGQDGYQVSCASTLSQAADCLMQRRFDVLLLDMQLGGDSGYQLAELARKQPQRPLMLAMSADPDEFADARSGWFAAQLSKPFDSMQLRAALARLPL